MEGRDGDDGRWGGSAKIKTQQSNYDCDMWGKMTTTKDNANSKGWKSIPPYDINVGWLGRSIRGRQYPYLVEHMMYSHSRSKD